MTCQKKEGTRENLIKTKEEGAAWPNFSNSCARGRAGEKHHARGNSKKGIDSASESYLPSAMIKQMGKEEGRTDVQLQGSDLKRLTSLLSLYRKKRRKKGRLHNQIGLAFPTPHRGQKKKELTSCTLQK